MKDYYDLYYLANKFDFDGATLTEALKKTIKTAKLAVQGQTMQSIYGLPGRSATTKAENIFKCVICAGMEITPGDPHGSGAARCFLLQYQAYAA